MIQILLLWDSSDSDDTNMIEKLRKGFDKMGCWKAELPPKGSTYKLVLTIEKENMRNYKEGQNGKKD